MPASASTTTPSTSGSRAETSKRSGWSDRPKVTHITTADWPTKAVRPANSVLDCGRIADAYGIAQPDWGRALDAVIGELDEVRA